VTALEIASCRFHPDNLHPNRTLDMAPTSGPAPQEGRCGSRTWMEGASDEAFSLASST
jgi:hypothetical protein